MKKIDVATIIGIIIVSITIISSVMGTMACFILEWTIPAILGVISSTALLLGLYVIIHEEIMDIKDNNE